MPPSPRPRRRPRGGAGPAPASRPRPPRGPGRGRRGAPPPPPGRRPGGRGAFDVSVSVTVGAEGGPELAAASGQVEAAARSLLCRLEPCTLRMAEARLCTLPGHGDRLGRARLLQSAAAVTLFPWLHAE